MKKMISFLFGLLALGSSMVSIANTTNLDATLTPNNPIYTLEIPSNPTTGYSWSLTSYDSNLITLRDHHYVAPNTRLIGAGGIEVWQFEATPRAFREAPLTTTVQLSYRRPWEKNRSPAQIKTMTIAIRR